ncbi:cobalamin B12-binding domain-containing protein [Aurantiacibacter marinus]|uniref:cobalamin B12-binding domain-containing protein n=1 Tax=Aurantiacibacter marinus TaxID=874156 RepID=UPI00069AB898|nr:cobalamin B12-binding domain-containing protein [Aurantiacibacter marinus]
MTSTPVVGRRDLRQFEKCFAAPEIYQRPDAADRQGSLARIVSGEIIPRLLRLHTEVVVNAPPIDDVIKSLRPNGAEIDELAHIVLGDDLDAAADYVTVMRDRGLSMEALYVELLEPTARFLGTMWENDECDFIDVTFGVARLQTLLSIFNETYALPEFETRRQVIMATTPGNHHVFGASMIEKLLVAGGWQVTTEYSGDADEIARTVRDNWFAVIGLTAGSDLQVEGLKSVIVDVRRDSKNRNIGIMVGGPIFTADPALAAEVGADATAPNAPAAVLAAQKLFDIAARK